MNNPNPILAGHARRALLTLASLALLTADYDLWAHPDDAQKLNDALAPLEMVPSRTPDEAQRVGRYVLENGERVDVLVARQVSTQDAVHVRFDDVFARAERVRTANPLGVSCGVRNKLGPNPEHCSASSASRPGNVG